MSFLSLNPFSFHNYGYPEISVVSIFVMISVVAFLLLVSKVLRKEPIEIPKKEFNNFNYDVLQPQGSYVEVRKVNITTKITVYILSGILIYTPLEELLNLNFPQYFYYSSWHWIF